MRLLGKNTSAKLLPRERRLSFSAKCARLTERLKEPEWRRYGAMILVGKCLGIALVFALIFALPIAWSVLPKMFSGTAMAQDTTEASKPEPMTSSDAMVEHATGEGAGAANEPTPETAPDPYLAVKPSDMINPLNTLWVLLGAFLVFGMQAGFTMLEAGFCRSRETVNVLVECVFDTCVCGLLHWGWGFAFMFGAGNEWVGWHDPSDPTKSYIFMKGVTVLSLYGTTGIPVFAHYLFQFAFADCASTICSGAMVGRTLFLGDVLYSIGVSGFIYPILGHWCWGPDGFLATMGSPDHFLPSLGINFHDFAGSTVVHSIGGWVAIAGAICLGPRLGRKFVRDGGGPMLPHDLTIAVVGGLILWFGWYGFNPCSTLSIMDAAGAGRVAMNTTLAACTGGLAAEFLMYLRVKKWDAPAMINGFLAGLVSITCPCYWVSDIGACVLGAVGGVLVILAMDLLEHLRIDDPVGAWPVHGVCGVWGTLSLGLFASGEYQAAGSSPTGVPSIVRYSPEALTGLFYGGGTKVLLAQCVGSLIVCSATFACAMLMFKVLGAMNLLRVSSEGELEGLDIDQHGLTAYPEYQVTGTAHQ